MASVEWQTVQVPRSHDNGGGDGRDGDGDDEVDFEYLEGIRSMISGDDIVSRATRYFRTTKSKNPRQGALQVV